MTGGGDGPKMVYFGPTSRCAQNQHVCCFWIFTQKRLICCFYRVIFFTGSALKVLSVGDGKIPSKKVKVEVSYRVFNSNFLFLVGILPSPTLRGCAHIM